MKLPNKLFCYEQSIISKFPMVLNALDQEDHLTIYQLYINLIGKFDNLIEFLDALECLYALGKIEYDYKLRRIYHVI